MKEDMKILLEEVGDWLYELRVPIVAALFLIVMFSVHSCEMKISIDSRPSQSSPQETGAK